MYTDFLKECEKTMKRLSILNSDLEYFIQAAGLRQQARCRPNFLPLPSGRGAGDGAEGVDK